MAVINAKRVYRIMRQNALLLERKPAITTLMKASRLERQLQQLSYARVLILNEISYLPMNREEASLFFRLLNRRYEKASIILTSNKGIRRLG